MRLEDYIIDISPSHSSPQSTEIFAPVPGTPPNDKIFPQPTKSRNSESRQQHVSQATFQNFSISLMRLLENRAEID